MTYALDTNIIIAILAGDKNVEENWEMAVASDGRFIIPPAVDYEIQRGLLYKPRACSHYKEIQICESDC